MQNGAHALESTNALIRGVKEKKMKSRNQREGKYVAGWCINPAYRKAMYKGKPMLQPKARAGRDYDLVSVSGYNDHGIILPGTTLVRVYRGE